MTVLSLAEVAENFPEIFAANIPVVGDRGDEELCPAMTPHGLLGIKIVERACRDGAKDFVALAELPGDCWAAVHWTIEADGLPIVDPWRLSGTIDGAAAGLRYDEQRRRLGLG